jgi:hypothetical protein
MPCNNRTKWMDQSLAWSSRLTAGMGVQGDAPSVASGCYWTEHGIAPLLSGDFRGAAFLLIATKH